ncbi:MAG TPA: AsmA-like C-terminal region-containing protein [Azospirillaceae bacterium]|nr:AsmA-like C-terminal region-containing protein [Azospirillaceae bacterium]
MTDSAKTSSPAPDTAPPPRRARLRRGVRVALEVLAAGVAGLGVLAGVLAWRLEQGPITVDFLTPVIESALNAPDGRVRVSIGATMLRWGGFEHPLELRARGVRALGEEGRPIASVPELGLGFSARALLKGQVLPTRLVLVRPQVRILRTQEGHFAFDIRAEEGGGVTAPEGELDVGAALLEALRQPPGMGDGPLAMLTRVAVSGASVVVEDQLTGLSVGGTRADVELARGVSGIQGEARVTLNLGERSARFLARLDHRRADGTTHATVQVDGLEPAALASLAPSVARLLDLSPDQLPVQAAALPLAGGLDLTLDRNFRLDDARFSLTAGPGQVWLPEVAPEPVDIVFLEARGQVDPKEGWLSIGDLFLDLGPDGQGERRQFQSAGTLHRDGDVVRATLRLDAALGETPFGLEAAAERRGDGNTHAELRFDGVEPARLARALPALEPMLEPLKRAALPLSGWAEANLGADLRPMAGRVELTGGAGELVLPELYPAPLAIHEMRLKAALEDGRRLVVEEAALGLAGREGGAGPVLSVAATAEAEGDIANLDGTVRLKNVPVDDLGHFWPEAVATKPRAWIVRNLSKGAVSEAWATLTAKAPLADPAALEPVRIDGGLEVAGATVNYMPPLPPVTNVSATARTDGGTFALDLHSGSLDDLKLSGDSTVVITEIGSAQEWIDIDLGIAGPVSTAMAVLDHPPLGYAAKLDIVPAKTKGTADTRLKFHFPLIEALDLDQVEVKAASKLRGVALDGVLGGRGVSNGDMALDLTTKGMTVKGKARVAGVPAAIDWTEHFSPVNGVRSRLTARGEIGDADRQRLGLDFSPEVTGPMGVEAVMLVDAKKRLSVKTGLDLARTRIDLPMLSWNKSAGVPGMAGFTAEFKDGRLTALSNLSAESRGLRARGGVDFDDAGHLAQVRLTEFVAGRTDVKAEARVLAGGGWAIRLDGARLDARGLMGKEGDDEPDKNRPPLDVTMKLGEARFGDEDNRVVTHVVGNMRRNAAGWDTASVEGRAEGRVPVTVRYMPKGGQRRLEAHSDDLGAVLRALDLNDKIRGGKVSITGVGRPDLADYPVEGHLDVEDYQVLNAPVLARLLNAMSLVGLADLLSGGPGLSFGRFDSDFRLDDNGLHLRQGRTVGGALGLTVEGRVDLDHEAMELQGTIVPVYTINRILGAIPILGDLLSGGEGQGLFAATYHVNGPFSDPEVWVNPLAVLAPGFLRNLFFLGSDGGEKP